MANPWTNNPFEPPRDAAVAIGGAPHDRGDVLWVLTSFEGRIPRRTYWLWTILVAIGFYAVLIVASIALNMVASRETADLLATLLVLVLYIPLLWFNLALQVKRWHDRDKSGWYVLVAFIPIVGSIWSFVECGCLRGTEGPNLYGADPT